MMETVLDSWILSGEAPNKLKDGLDQSFLNSMG